MLGFPQGGEQQGSITKENNNSKLKQHFLEIIKDVYKDQDCCCCSLGWLGLTESVSAARIMMDWSTDLMMYWSTGLMMFWSTDQFINISTDSPIDGPVFDHDDNQPVDARLFLLGKYSILVLNF